LAIAPATIQFTYGTHGKPFLNSTRHPNPLSFNLAHSQDRALFAFSRTGTLGVDIEHLRQDVDALALSQRFFAQREHRAIADLPSNQQVPAFFCLWTCKEAYLKATGEGLAGLPSVEIDILPDGTIGLHQRQPPPLEVGLTSWHVYRCWPGTGYVGAIALKRDNHQLPLSIRLFEYRG
jgi:4'-phosphopantetheinyl transferase